MQHIFQASPAGRQYAEPSSVKAPPKDESLEMSLREHLLAAAQAGSQTSLHPLASPISSQAPLSQLSTNILTSQQGQSSDLVSSAVSGEHTDLGVAIDTAMPVGQYAVPSPHDSHNAILSQNSPRTPARPLSTTKRAAQNRAAQV